ncbi:MAG TPA: hypothetical protein VGH94_12850 [Acidimicrobiales bacterium]|jgi:hypothetical protein
MHTYRLRLELPAEATISHDVGGAISRLGGNVVSVDLHEVEGAAAVDEIVVELPGEIDGTRLRSALELEPDVALLSSKTCDPGETLAEAHRWARDADPGARRHEGPLPQLVASACPMSAVWLGETRDAETYPAVRMAVERQAAVAQRATDLPDTLAPRRSRSPRWLLAVPNRDAHATDIALLSRPMSLRFTATEVARVEVLLAS